MSLSTQKSTDSQSRIGRHHRGWYRRHQSLAAGLAITVSDLLAGRSLAEGKRRPGGANPWGHPVTPGGARKVFTFDAEIPATPEQIFPLLCPVLEYEWLDDWACDVQYSASGVAEEGCAFRTDIQVGERWICSRHEPPTAIQYVVWMRVGWMVLDLSLEDRGDGSTMLRWRRTFTATGSLGRKLIGTMTEAGVRRDMEATNQRLAAYLARESGQRAVS
jgi:hypothetical protein